MGNLTGVLRDLNTLKTGGDLNTSKNASSYTHVGQAIKRRSTNNFSVISAGISENSEESVIQFQ